MSIKSISDEIDRQVSQLKQEVLDFSISHVEEELVKIEGRGHLGVEPDSSRVAIGLAKFLIL